MPARNEDARLCEAASWAQLRGAAGSKCLLVHLKFGRMVMSPVSRGKLRNAPRLLCPDTIVGFDCALWRPPFLFQRASGLSSPVPLFSSPVIIHALPVPLRSPVALHGSTGRCCHTAGAVLASPTTLLFCPGEGGVELEMGKKVGQSLFTKKYLYGLTTTLIDLGLDVANSFS